MSALGMTDLSIALIRVEFEQDDSPATAGDGRFLGLGSSDIICEEWFLDPPPHNVQFFNDHLVAVGNYWERVSGGRVTVDLAASGIFPASGAAYQLDHAMLFYHPYLEEFDETRKLIDLVRDAVLLADDDVDFSAYNTVIVVHAGMGGDFAFVLDPTPGNIPSAYLNEDDFAEYGQITTDEGILDHAIILPESQNFMQYPETSTLFEDATDPCFYQVALNGTMALMLGFHLGLPPMYDTEEGRSRIGGFGLMDQGSNNWHGVVPTLPNPYTRILMGWDSYELATIGDTVRLETGASPIRIDIASNEYFLVENRQRNLVDAPGYVLWIDSLAQDTVSVIVGSSGVVMAVDELDAGIPGNGLLIWHIDESAEFTETNPNGGPVRLVDLEEADGAQDLGYETQLLFADYLETGWWFDPWFAGNEGWFHMNRGEPVIGDSLIRFTPNTHPNTDANTGLSSNIWITDISAPGSVMSFVHGLSRYLNPAGIDSILGFQQLDLTANLIIWATREDSLLPFEQDRSGLIRSSGEGFAWSDLLQDTIGPEIHFEYPWWWPEISRSRNVQRDRGQQGWYRGHVQT